MGLSASFVFVYVLGLNSQILAAAYLYPLLRPLYFEKFGEKAKFGLIYTLLWFVILGLQGLQFWRFCCKKSWVLFVFLGWAGALFSFFCYFYGLLKVSSDHVKGCVFFVFVAKVFLLLVAWFFAADLTKSLLFVFGWFLGLFFLSFLCLRKEMTLYLFSFFDKNNR